MIRYCGIMGRGGAMAERRLFEELPEQAVPARERGAPRLQEARRDQFELRAVDLEGLVASDDPVRSVWAFVETLDLSPLYAAIEAREGEPGRAPIDPKILMALWLWATLRGVGSGREVERPCEREVTFQWLCGGVGVNYHTLSDFRIAHEALLDRLLSEGVASLVEAGLVKLDRVAVDGIRVRASAGAGSYRRRGRLSELLSAAHGLVHRLRRELDDDPGAGKRRREAAEKRAAAERLARLKAAKQRLEALEAERARRAKTNRNQVKKQGEPRISTTDPQARVMKMADGGFRPAYNGQIASEPVSGVVLGVAVDTTGSDRGLLQPMLEWMKARYGSFPTQALADGGFVCNDDVERAAEVGTAVFMPLPESKHGRDPHEPRAEDGPGVAAWRRRMASEEGKRVYRQRGLAERVHAVMRQHGLTRLTVRGSAKARIVLLWHALAHNLQCMLRLRRAAQPA
jgi:transposase